MLAKDGIGRFRGADLGASLASERIASAQLRIAMAAKSRDPQFLGYESQGDEPQHPLDLFEDRKVPDHRLHKHYLALRDNLARSPAKRVFQAISPWLISSDPHLVREFQEGQFDQRLWEIYLWAMLRDQGYDVEHQEAPDLLVTSPWFSFSMEATTVAPSTSGALAKHPNPKTPEEVAEFLTNYMPMKFGSPLVTKLNKVDVNGAHYWEKPRARDLPFVIAIADFHKDAAGAELGSMTYSQGGLYPYLYGTRISTEIINDRMVFRNERVTEHTYNGKTVPSGFFDLPKSENVSAVLFSNAGTLAKFDRIGALAGFAPPHHEYIRIGYTFNPDPGATVGTPFKVNVADPGYQEFWGDEIQIFHNPRAKYPLAFEAFPDAMHVFYEDGGFNTIDRPGRVLTSMTIILHKT